MPLRNARINIYCLIHSTNRMLRTFAMYFRWAKRHSAAYFSLNLKRDWSFISKRFTEKILCIILYSIFESIRFELGNIFHTQIATGHFHFICVVRRYFIWPFSIFPAYLCCAIHIQSDHCRFHLAKCSPHKTQQCFPHAKMWIRPMKRERERDSSFNNEAYQTH